jgi:hypothetical protein
MKLLIVSATLILVFTCGCKLETSSATPNSNAPANANQSAKVTSVRTEGNSNCSLTLAAAPAIGGLKVGMTKEDVLAAFPGAKEDQEVRALLNKPANKFGTSEMSLRPEKFGRKDQLPGIDLFTLTFLDNSLLTEHVKYNGPEYPDVDKFVTAFLEGKTLPALAAWEAYPGLDTQLKTLRCSEFEVQVFAGGAGGNLNYISVKDLVADKELRDRRAKLKAQATPTPNQ